jgi:phytoene dehydrogenase-like protein
MSKIIIIGGGISGLTAGIYALTKGFEVEIYESHNVVGGMCAQWQRKGNVCTSAVHWIMGIRKDSNLHEIWKDTGAIDNETDFFILDYISAGLNEDEYCYLYADIDKLETELLRVSPQDKDAIQTLINEIKMYQKLPIPADKPMELMLPMEKAVSFAPYIKVEKRTLLNSISVAEYVERFQSPVIRQLLESVIPDCRLSAGILMTWLAANCNGDIAFPLHGFFAMAKRMEQKFLSLGGTIHTNSPVKKIIVKENIAIGLLLVDGNEVNADYIISTVSFDVLLEKLLDNQYRDVYFEQCITNTNRFFAPALTLVNLNIEADMSKFPHTLMIEAKNPIFINKAKMKYLKINHYAFSPCFCKEGKTLVQAVLQEQEFEYWEKLKAASVAEYEQVKTDLAKQVIKEIERIYPQTNGKITLLDVATPLSLQRYCHSYHGSYLSFSDMSGQRENHESVIYGVKNLYLAGQWVFRDGGLPMAAIAGKFAIQRICNQENINTN